jgi:ATP-dependent Lon protease
LSLVRRYRCASPGVILDELEKVATSAHNGNLLDAILALLERETAAAWVDPYAQARADLSHVVWLGTANSIDRLPRPLLDRCRVLQFPDPGPDHLETLATRLLQRMVADSGLDERWARPFSGIEMDALARHWSGGSLRALERLVEVVFNARSLAPSLH